MANLYCISKKQQALEDMRHAAEEAAAALREVCMVVDAIALDMSFARHASRLPLRLSSDRLENIARTIIGESYACGPVGAKHTSIVGEVALAAATISVLPFAEDAGQVAMHQIKASHERATKNLEWVQEFAESAQSEIRKDLYLKIRALVVELDRLAVEGGGEMIVQRRELEEAISTRQLPAGWALEGLDQVIVKIQRDAERTCLDEDRGSVTSHWETLAMIEFEIAEIFAQLTGDTPL